MTTRGDEIVAREAPGKAEAGIAILRGNVRVRLLGERDGWSEVLLPDGRRAWVPAGDLVHAVEAARPSADVPATATPAAAPSSESGPDAREGLATEVARLRSVVDALAAERRQTPPRAGDPASVPEVVPIVAAGIGLVVGVLVGGVWERHRARRGRSLRF
ncbi:MAG: SH3 domain-containing protein [Deltaproteobacteria bacterium]|nr:SH3 domain-containing protein [Deltaproteobacteria bacterium]